MNETLQQALTSIITNALTTAESAAEFLLAEMPLVVQQLLMWKAVYSFLWFALCMGLTVALLIGARRLRTWIYTPLVVDQAESERKEYLRSKGYANRSTRQDREFARLESLNGRIDEYGGMQWVPRGLSLAPFIMGLAFCMDWLQIWIAPKVYLLEYAASLVTNK